jgi:hypothetical protein
MGLLLLAARPTGTTALAALALFVVGRIVAEVLSPEAFSAWISS